MVDSDATMTSDMMSAGAEGVQAAPPPVPAPSAGGLVDLLGLDLLSDDVSASPAPSTSSADKVILSAESGDGCTTYVLQDGKMFQRMTLENKAITLRHASKDPLAGPLNSAPRRARRRSPGLRSSTTRTRLASRPLRQPRSRK